jgi:uncharacterized protein YcaQ
VTVHELSPHDARRIAVRAQLLDRGRPDGLLDVVRRLTLLQVDPTAAIAPDADLVAWSRLRSSYSRAEPTQALKNRTLLELRAMIRPAEDLGLYRADMASWAARTVERDWQKGIADWVHANDACRRDILARLDASGPLPSRELPDSCAKPWRPGGRTPRALLLPRPREHASARVMAWSRNRGENSSHSVREGLGQVPT